MNKRSTISHHSPLLIDIPFYPLDNNLQCMQVCIQMITSHLLKKEYSLEEIDKLCERKNNQRTLTLQWIVAFYKLWINAVLISGNDWLLELKKWEEYYKTHFDIETAEIYLKNLNIWAITNMVDIILNNKLFISKKLNIQDIETFLESGKLVITLVDFRTLYNKKGPYLWHYLIITGVDNEYVYYHETAPWYSQKHKKSKKEVFLKAMSHEWCSWDAIIIEGINY